MTLTTTTQQTAAPFPLPLGTTPEGAPVTWQLLDENSQTEHGIITGPRGCGGTTALRRLATQARAAGVHTVQIDLDGGPAWGPEAAAHHITTSAQLEAELVDALTQDYDTDAPILLLVDGHQALTEQREAWERLLIASRALGVAVVARLHSLAQIHCGGSLVRSLLLGSGQYAALGAGLDLAAPTTLPGYQEPNGTWQETGTGLYGHRGQTTPLTVTA
ncbi:AAA family ATPase [Nocardiopsis sp. RV163]|uniref:AAA family ATPase n=1 Tax=Nocardiopsis sp. RV163 TaxID=1661388 RepID=UPI00064BECB6|nr:AAA family ATPase [Nocardiopsis sp. RV163]